MNGRQRRKCDVYSQKFHVSAKPINCLPFYMLKISAELKKKKSHKLGHCMDFRSIER